MTPNRNQDPFLRQATEVVGVLQDRLSKMIEAKCGADLATGRIAEVFGIHRKLAWQISRVAYDQDPFTAARHMPTEKGVQLLIRTARDRGVEPGTLDAVEKAAAAFEDLVEAYGGDRSAIDLLLSACSATQDDEEAARWRQQAFVGNSFIWGAQCRTLHSVIVQFPSVSKDGYFDMAQVRSLVGFRLNKPHTHWVVGQSAIVAGGVSSQATRVREPIDPEGALGGAPVMRAHCRGDLPQFVRRENPDAGLIDDLLIPTAVGLKGERTIVTGEVIRALAPAYATPEDSFAHFGVGVRTPAESLVFDQFVHKSLFVGVSRESRVFSDLNSPVACDDSDRLEPSPAVQDLGMGLTRSQCRDVPGYARLLRDVFDHLRQNPDDFHLRRITMAYPPMPATVMIRHELPDRDAADA